MKAISCAVVVVAPSLIQACCTAFPAAHPITLVREKVIIIWNAEEKMQHFIRQASFRGKAKDFGFIVPTPSVPKIVTADDRAFGRVESLIPKPPRRATGAETASASKSAGSVQVIESYKVGDYQATILRATDGTAMLGWLKANGYDSRPAMESWLDHYAKQKWVFAALKFIRTPEQRGEQTNALRISFKTEVPHYPYKMPGDTWPLNHYRPLALYFIGTGVADIRYRGTKNRWEAEEVWRGAVPSDVMGGLMNDLKLSESDFPKGAMVTAFKNSNNAQGYDRDLDFFESPDRSTWIWYGLGLTAVGAIVWRLKTRA